MYKITNQFTNPHLILIRKKLTDGSTAALLVMGHPNRMISSSQALNQNAVPTEKCPPAPNPHPIEPKSRKFFWTTVGAVILTGAGCVYAKNNKEARNWLASNVPWADKFVGIVYQEKQTYSEFIESQISKGSEKVSHFVFGKEGRYPIKAPSQAYQNIEEDAKKLYAPKNYELPPYRLSPLYEEEQPECGVPEVEVEALLVETEKSTPPPAPKINVTKEVVELEEQAHINTRLAVDNYKKAHEACQKYNKLLYKIVEGGVDDINHLDLSASRSAKDERDQAQSAAKEAVEQARDAIQKLETMMDNGEIAAPPDAIVQTKRFITTFKKDIDQSEKDFQECLAKANLSDKYWHKVQEARQYFKKDLEILYPGIDLNRKNMELQNDTDLLLMHLMNIVQSLNKDIAELQTIRDYKLNRAIECNDQDELKKQKVQVEIQKEISAIEQEHLRKIFAIRTEANNKLRESIKKQMQLNQEVLECALKKKEAEINKKFKAKACEEVQKTRLEYKQKIAELVGKLKAIEQTLKQRAKSEEEAKKSQALWTAGEALMATTKSRECHVKIADEVNALEKAGKCDECVKAVIKGISKEAREKGIMSEKAIKETFDQLEKTTTKVALVGREGAGLITYFLSWLQSKLIFKTLAEIPDDELNNKPTDFSELDTFEIMQRARYYMDQNEMETALKYVNLLRGAPRVAASGWVQEARRTLEVRQAANVIMTHASCQGMTAV